MSKRPARILGFVSLLLISALATINLAQKQTPAPAATPQKNVTKPLVNTAAKPAVTNLPTNLPTGMPVEAQQALVKQYCSGCHNDKTKSGGMTLTKLDLAHPEQNAELTEKVIHQVKYGQ